MIERSGKAYNGLTFTSWISKFPLESCVTPSKPVSTGLSSLYQLMSGSGMLRDEHSNKTLPPVVTVALAGPRLMIGGGVVTRRAKFYSNVETTLTGV